MRDASQVEDEAQWLVYGSEILRTEHADAGRQPLGRYDAQVIAAGERGVVQAAAARPQLDVAAQAVGGRGDRDDHDPVNVDEL